MFDESAWRSEQIAEFRAAKNSNPSKYATIVGIKGCRGRVLFVYEDRVVIRTDVTAGSLLTNNATDGDKTIFYHDVVGIQFKKPGVTIGYLQLETPSGQMNNVASNAFSENTFTFDKLTEGILETKEFIEWKVSQFKQLPNS